MKKSTHVFLLSSLVFTLATTQMDVEANQQSETEVDVTFVRPITPNPDNLPGGTNPDGNNGNSDSNKEETNNIQDGGLANTPNHSNNQSGPSSSNREELTTLLNKEKNQSSKHSLSEDKNLALGSQVKSYPSTGSTGEKFAHLLKWSGGFLLILCVWLWRKTTKEVA